MKLVKYRGFIKMVRYDEYDPRKVEHNEEKYEYSSYRKLVRLLKKRVWFLKENDWEVDVTIQPVLMTEFHTMGIW